MREKGCVTEDGNPELQKRKPCVQSAERTRSGHLREADSTKRDPPRLCNTESPQFLVGKS